MENASQVAKLIISDSKLSFMQARYEKSLQLVRQTLYMIKITFDFATI